MDNTREEQVPGWPAGRRREEIGAKKSRITPSLERPFDRIAPEPFARAEGERCLECNFVCDKCVDVCPNRANILLPVDPEAEPLFRDSGQIIHIDSYCNECGNCGHFCPWTEGVPYRDKPTVFSSAEDMEDSANSGWFLDGGVLHWRLGEARGSSAVTAGRAADVPDLEDAAPFFRLFELLLRDRPSLFDPVQMKTPEEIEA